MSPTSLIINEVTTVYRTDSERDVFNEKPSKEEQMAATQVCIGAI